jgi:hypothetical protein
MKISKGIRTLMCAVMASSLAFTLAACEGQVPQVATSTSSTQAPDLSQDQEKEIRGKILEVLNKANAAKDPSLLSSRVTGPQLQIRTSELKVAKATGTLDAKTTIPSDIMQTVIPTDSGWPRSVFTITTTTDDQQSKRLLVLDQNSAQENYKLWGVARLFPGAELPKFQVPSIGSQMGQTDDSGLEVTPEQAVQHYADLLQNGSSSKYVDEFAADYFRQDLAKLTETVQEGMAANNGTQKQAFSVQEDGIKVMRSSDGGDLVVAQINSVWTRTAGEGRESLPASDAEKALFGSTKATSTIKASYVNVIAMYIPAAGSDAKIQAVGAERQPITVQAE